MLIILSTHPIQYQVPLWQALARSGNYKFEVWYFTAHASHVSRDEQFGKSFAWDLDMLAGYPHRFLDSVPGATPNTFWKCRTRESLGERMRKAKVTTVWIQGWQVAGYWQAVWAAKEIGAEVWLRGESNDLGSSSLWRRGLKRIVLGELFRRVDRFLCIGSANRRLYRKFGVPEAKLYAAPYAVDNKRFAAQAEAARSRRSEIRRQWGIPEDAFCVLFCGKFIPKKRPLDLVNAAKRLMSDDRLANLHLLYVGSGQAGEELRRECNVMFDADANGTNVQRLTENAKPTASFPGFLNQTEISRAYVAADCLVLPSDFRETWGLVVNEAMASDLPCIISDQCGCAEDLGYGVNSTFPCGNIDALARRICSLAGNESGGRACKPPSLLETLRTIQDLLVQPKKVRASDSRSR